MKTSYNDVIRILDLAILQLENQIDAVKLGGKPFGAVGGFERDSLVNEKTQLEARRAQLNARQT